MSKPMGRPEIVTDGVTINGFRVSGAIRDKIDALVVDTGMPYSDVMRHILDRFFAETEAAK